MNDTILETKQLHFRFAKASMPALQNINFELRHGESLGIVGESGSGKSTLARLLVRLLKACAGEISYQNQAIEKFQRRQYARLVQLVFQDALASLNPRQTIAKALAEVLKYHRKALSGVVDSTQVCDLVGLSEHLLGCYPHQLSGGQRQRAALARALLLQPQVLVADEIVSALDVSIQAQIIQLLQSLLSVGQFSLIFISHDLAVVQQLANRILVMFQGHIVEVLNTQNLHHAQHPYTQALLASIPVLHPAKRHNNLKTHATVLNQANAQGCPFAARCALRQTVCDKQVPVLRSIEHDHQVACFALKLV